jgi:hypothetical protein
MKKSIKGMFRYVYACVSLTLIALLALMPVLSQEVGASGSGGLLEPRSITMSDSTPGATGVTYQVKFTPVTPETTTGAIIIDFCSDTPIIGATCAYSNATVPVDTSATSSAGTLTTSGYHGHTMEITGLSWTTSPFTITFSNMTNPTQSCASTICTFYARILTYPTTAAANAYTPAASTGGTTTTGSYVDWGGDALSTAQVLSLTATVMESLTFCDSGSTITTCGTTTVPSVTLGHGGPPVVLTATAIDGGYVYTQTSTNAGNGVSVALKTTTSTTCGGLSSNLGVACQIPSVNTGASAPTATALTAGTAAVGMCVQPGSGVTAAQPYNGTCTSTPTTDQMGFNDSTNASWNTKDLFSTYGSPIFTSTGALNGINDTLEFAATAATTTPAGIYTANYVLVATGSF